MIYFQNHRKGKSGLNNHVIPYTLAVALSNFLEREFFFDHEIPTITLPPLRPEGRLESRIRHVIDAPRSLVSDLLAIPGRRVFEIDRTEEGKHYVEDPMLMFMTDRANRDKFADTMIWNFFSLGRGPLIKEDLEKFRLIEFGDNCIINASFFFFLEREAKQRLLDSIKVIYRIELETLGAKIADSLGRFNAIHLRLGDFQTIYGSDGYTIEPEMFASLLRVVFDGTDLPVLIATDEFQQKDAFRKILEGYRYEFIDEIILADYFDDFRSLPFSDFNSLAIINQLICAAGERFVGTCRSTFTSVIHRLRQERFGKTDFDFFPDERVRRHLDSNLRTVPDGKGFFEWNRYSAFAEHYEYPAWMREWNYSLTSV
jgi:hypothetical protein